MITPLFLNGLWQRIERSTAGLPGDAIHNSSWSSPNVKLGKVGARHSLLGFSRFRVAVRSSDDGAIQPSEVSPLPFMLILHETALFLYSQVRDLISEWLCALREADSIFISSLKEAGLYDQL